MTLSTGARLGPYEILAPLGAGGMGEVYRARDTRLGREVAVKVLPTGMAADAEGLKRFEREAKATAALSHPNILAVHDVGTQEGVPYLVEELLEGESLRERLLRGAIPLPEAVGIAAQIAHGLVAAHEKHIVHRDLKPGNVFLTSEGTVKILDFGLAKLVEGAPDDEAETLSHVPFRTTEFGRVLGTTAYMSPEQARGDRADHRSDQFSLGIVLYEMLVGKRPFGGASAAEMLAAIIRDEPEPVTKLDPKLPELLGRIVQRCLSKDPEERYSSTGDLAKELQNLRTHLPEIVSVAGAAPGERPVRTWPKRFAAPAGVGVALALLGWFVLERSARPALAFKERDFVLVGDVVNETGEPVFDLALKGALETSLRQSQYVNVLEPAQVENMLRMMRRKPDTRLDRVVGRDLCLRSGARALLVPGIVKAGEAYVVQAILVEPTTSRVVDEVRVSALGHEQVLLTAIDDLSSRVRRRLGESLASLARTNPPFAQYTTSSLEALQLLGLGRKAWAVGDFAKAERSFREALKHDPRFTAARGSLGLVLIQFLGRPEEGRKELAQALADAGEVSQREHLHLRALNRQFVTGDMQGALDDYRFMSELYPDMVAPYNNSGQILKKLGRFPEAAAMYERAHQADPRSAVPIQNAFYLCTGPLKDPRKAEDAARALIALNPGDANARHALAWTFVMQRRFAEAEEEMRATLQFEPSHAYARPNLALLQLRRGAVEEAISSFRSLSSLDRGANKDDDALCLALALRAAGRRAEAESVAHTAAEAMKARGQKSRLDSGDEALLAALLAVAGCPAEARAHVARAERAGEPSGGEALWLARAYAALGEVDRAAALAAHALETGCEDPYYVLIDPSLAAVCGRPEIDRLLPTGSL